MTFSRVLVCSFLGALLTFATLSSAKTIKVAILGDSLATGAGAHPNLTFDKGVFAQIFNNKIAVNPVVSDIPEYERFGLEGIADGPLAAPQRAWPSSREFKGGAEWIFQNFMAAISHKYLNTEEYSWGYLTARGLGVPADNILIAAQDGARTKDIPRQLDRILDLTQSVLPEQILVLFTGNDLCAPRMSMVTNATDYESDLNTGIEYLIRNGKPHPNGTTVYVVGFLNALQLLHSDEILNTKVTAFGEEMSCKQLREQRYQNLNADVPAPGGENALEAFLYMNMPPNPLAYCPTLFGTSIDSEAGSIGKLANRIHEYRDAQKKLVKNYTEAETPGLNWEYVDSPTKVIFDGNDIAGDCFHLSPHGQSKVAAAILQDINKL